MQHVTHFTLLPTHMLMFVCVGILSIAQFTSLHVIVNTMELLVQRCCVSVQWVTWVPFACRVSM